MNDDRVTTLNEDITYIFNTNRHLPYEGQIYLCDNTLNFLDSVEAAEQYSPADLIYIRKVWTEVRKRVDAKYGPNS